MSNLFFFYILCYNLDGDNMKTLKNCIPLFLLISLIVVVIMVLMPEKNYKLEFEEVTKVYTIDYNIEKKYNDKIVDLLEGLELVRNNGTLNGIYNLLYIKDYHGTKTFYIFANGKIAYKRGNDYYITTNKDVTDKINEYIRIYDVEYLSRPLYVTELNKKYSSPADKTIQQQSGDTNVRFIFNREVSYLKMIYTDRVAIEESCYKEGLDLICDYEYVEKVISNQKYSIKEGETLDFKFNKETYKYGLRVEITDFNGETSVVDIKYSAGTVKISDIYIKEEE